MKVIIPVAGEGKRLRPFTFTKPKQLLPVAGKPILDHIMDLVLPLEPSEVVFITGHLKDQIEEHVTRHYSNHTKVTCIEQRELNGTAGAINLARHAFDEDLLIIFGDTIFSADMSIIKQATADAIIWAMEVEDPSRFGVIVTQDGHMTRMVEKPKEFVSNLANIGVYYVKNKDLLAEGIDHAIRNKQEGREAYLTDAFAYMIEKGAKIRTAEVTGWFDCGTPEALLDSNKILLPDHHKHSHEATNIIIPPVSIHPDAKVENCRIGPHVSIGPYAQLKAATLTDCIVDARAVVADIALQEMIVGEGMVMKGVAIKNI